MCIAMGCGMVCIYRQHEQVGFGIIEITAHIEFFLTNVST